MHVIAGTRRRFGLGSLAKGRTALSLNGQALAYQLNFKFKEIDVSKRLMMPPETAQEHLPKPSQQARGRSQ